MKMVFKIYGWAWVALLAITLVVALIMFILPSHHELAQDPSKFVEEIKIDLPDIANTESTDNLSRGASRWDVFAHRSQFAEPLSEKQIQALDELCLIDVEHWSKNSEEGYYAYSNEGGIDELYSVSCRIYREHMCFEYAVDESEGMFVFAPLSIAYTLLFFIGIILGITALIRLLARFQR